MIDATKPFVTMTACILAGIILACNFPSAADTIALSLCATMLAFAAAILYVITSHRRPK